MAKKNIHIADLQTATEVTGEEYLIFQDTQGAVYTPVGTLPEAPVFEPGVYFKKDGDNYVMLDEMPEDWSTAYQTTYTRELPNTKKAKIKDVVGESGKIAELEVTVEENAAALSENILKTANVDERTSALETNDAVQDEAIQEMAAMGGLVGKSLGNGNEIFNCYEDNGTFYEKANTISKGAGNKIEGADNAIVEEGSMFCHIEGKDNTITGKGSIPGMSHVEGNGNNLFYGIASHVEGLSNVSKGEYCHVEGVSNEASAEGSHAEGLSNEVHSGYSHAEGTNNIVAAYSSHAEGNGTRAGAVCSEIYSVDRTNVKISFKQSDEIKGWEGSDTIWIIKPKSRGGVESYTIATIVSLGDDGKSIVVTNLPASITDFTNQTNSGIYVWNKSKNTGGTIFSNSSCHTEGADTIALGSNCHAEGGGTIAFGHMSHVEGSGSYASGDCSHAEGNNAVASGVESHAEGYSTNASGAGSHAEGTFATASGDNSHSEGNKTEASGRASHAEGYLTFASGIASHAEGGETAASGAGSHAEGGGGTKASADSSHAEGESTNASGTASHAEGAHTVASENYSHAEGGATTASGSCAHAEGSGSVASGTASHAEGGETAASGYASHAEGEDTTASGDYSHAEGAASSASGEYSHAEGNFTRAKGAGAHTEGCETIASGTYQHVQGKFNVEDTDNIYAHIVGNGTGVGEENPRSNAHTLDWDGNSWYAGNIKIGGTSYGDPEAKRVGIRTEISTPDLTNNTLLLESNNEYRLTSKNLTSLTLATPTTISNDYECSLSLKSGATPISLVYSETPIIWKGVDCDANGVFIPQANTIYEICIKNIGSDESGNPIIVARVGDC